MIKKKFCILVSLLLCNHLCFAAFTYRGMEMDEVRHINGVEVRSGRSGDLRSYHAVVGTELNGKFDQVVERILKFQDRCNNEYRDRREFSDKNFNCPFHNENLVESVVLENLRKTAPAADKDVIRQFVLWRKIYNREEFQYYDLVQVKEVKTKVGEREYAISYRKLSDEEAKLYVENARASHSAFNFTEGGYKVIELSESKTKVEVTYASQTDHWLLNSGLAVGIICKSVAKGTKNTLDQLAMAVQAK